MAIAESDGEGDWAEAPREETGAHALPRGLRIVVAGASVLDGVPEALLHYIGDGLPEKSIVFLRRGLTTAPGRFERLVAEWCRQFTHVEARWIVPEPGGGPGSVFDRDRDMVAHSDAVLAFFAPGRMMEGGTGHVVESAIDQGVPVYSFVIGDLQDDGMSSGLARVGEHDPTAAWQDTIKHWFEAE